MKIMKSIITCFTILTVCMAQAQWTTDTAENTLVAESEATDMQAKTTSNGMTYVAFWKEVEAPENLELRLQILDENGNQTLGVDGMLVSEEVPMSTYTVAWDMVVDDNDDLYLGVTGTGSGNPAYAFKLDSDGNHLWSASGVNFGNGFVPKITPLSTDNVLISWASSNGTVMQKYDAAGTAIWTSAQPIEQGGNATYPANFFELDNGDYIAVFHSLLYGVYTNFYAQRYDNNGNEVWAEALQLSDSQTAYNRNYSGLQDGDVVYMSYYAAANNRFDAYLQRIDPDGTTPWGLNGMDFSLDANTMETKTNIAYTEGSDFVWAISRTVNNAQSESGEFVQKFDKNSGARQFTDNAKEVFAIGSETIHMGKLWLVEDTPYFLNQEGQDNGASPVTLNAVYLDENGDFVWPEETKPVATFEASKGRVHFTKPINNQSVAVFVEDKGNGMLMYAQNFIDETMRVEGYKASNFTYNNPVQNIVTLKSTTAIHEVNLYNVLGQQVFHKSFSGAKEIKINAQGWNKGVYIMKLDIEGSISKSIKLIKE